MALETVNLLSLGVSGGANDDFSPPLSSLSVSLLDESSRSSVPLIFSFLSSLPPLLFN